MSCSCDYDRPEFCDVRTVNARRVHNCSDCRRDIQIGESYQRVSGKWEGEVSTFCVCADCRLVRDLIDLYLEAEEARVQTEIARRIREGIARPGHEWLIRREIATTCNCAPTAGDLLDWIAEWERENGEGR